MSAIDLVTLIVFVAFWPVWLAWELVLLYLRSSPGRKPPTISMVARDRGWHLNSVVYLWAGLATHFWWPSQAYATVVGGVLFWLLAAALLGQDIWLWKSDPATWPKWLRWQRWPALWLPLGALAGRFLFPQAGGMP